MAIEKCVRCGKETQNDESTPVMERRYFVEGSGQLCEECWRRVYDCDKIEKTLLQLTNEDKYPM